MLGGSFKVVKGMGEQVGEARRTEHGFDVEDAADAGCEGDELHAVPFVVAVLKFRWSADEIVVVVNRVLTVLFLLAIPQVSFHLPQHSCSRIPSCLHVPQLVADHQYLPVSLACMRCKQMLLFLLCCYCRCLPSSNTTQLTHQ